LCEIYAKVRSATHLLGSLSKAGRFGSLPRSISRPSLNHSLAQIFNCRGRISFNRSLFHLDLRSPHLASLAELRGVGNKDDADEVSRQLYRTLSECGQQKAEVQRCCRVPAESLNNVPD
jgi:hypothetical protein